MLHSDFEMDRRAKGASFVDENYHYKYPRKLKLRPGTDFHDKLVSRVMQMMWESHRTMSRRYDSWRKIDETTTAYIATDSAEDQLKNEDSRKPVSVVIPMSLAMLETLLAHFVATFLEKPYFRYRGVEVEDIPKAILLEKVVNLQMLKYKTGLRLITQWRDQFCYGIGAISPNWEVTRGKRRTVREEGFWSDALGEFVVTGHRRSVRDTVLFEGNKFHNLDPYKFFPDPTTSATRVQDGQFVGWADKSTYINLFAEESAGDSGIFNVKYLQHTDGQSMLIKGENRDGRETGLGGAEPPIETDTVKPIDQFKIYVRLIPSEWKLGNKDEPEVWYFRIGGDRVLMDLKPLNLDHGMFPVAETAPYDDGYQITPPSPLETTYGLQIGIDWMWNAHVANVRKAINDMLLVDPKLVMLESLKKPGPGKIIFLNERVWGRGKDVMDAAVKQFPVTDVTRGHVTDMGILIELMERSTGVPGALQGVFRKGPERMAGSEARDTRISALGRVGLFAEITSMSSMHDLALMCASHTQQFMDREMYVEIAGDTEDLLRQEYNFDDRIRVSPYDIIFDYDIIPSDASMSSKAFVDTQVRMFEIIMQQPELLQGFDVMRLFKHIMRLSGVQDVGQFQKVMNGTTTTVAPNDQVLDQARRGNIVPAAEAANARNIREL